MLAPGKHYIGDVVRLAVNYSALDTDVDPETVKLSIRDPYGRMKSYTYDVDPEIFFLDTGDYYIDFIPNASGRWHYRWVSTGSGTTSALEGDFLVQASPFYDGWSRDYA